MAGGPVRVLAWLGLCALAVAAFAGWVLWLIHSHRTDPDASMSEAIWESGTRLLDPGTFSGDVGWNRRFITLFVTVCGLILTSVLIGLTAAGFDSKLIDLRKGHGRALETGHTLILGWSPRIFVLLNELVAANRNQRRATLVILADEDAEWMHDEVRKRVSAPRSIRVLCRNGQPSTPGDLERVEAGRAKSIVILGPDGRSDALAVKAMLGLISIAHDFEQIPVIVELNDARNRRDLAIHHNIVPVRGDDVMARVTAQSCRQAGLAEVLMDLLDFGGDEIYFHDLDALIGLPFGEAQLRLENSCLIGVRTAGGEILLAPPREYVLQAGDESIVIAQDDDTTVLGDYTTARPLPGGSMPQEEGGATPERLMILNWNHLAPRILIELDGYVPLGSSVTVVLDHETSADLDDINECLANLTVALVRAEDDQERAMEILAANVFDHVLFLGSRGDISAEEADARTLVAVMAIDRKLPLPHRPRLVAEVRDERSGDLMKTAGADDFVISSAISGFLLAQLAERIDLNDVFQELFDACGARVEMVPVGEYVDLTDGPITATFAELVATVSASSGALIGFKKPNADVQLNPSRRSGLTLDSADQLVVVRQVAVAGLVGAGGMLDANEGHRR